MGNNRTEIIKYGYPISFPHILIGNEIGGLPMLPSCYLGITLISLPLPYILKND